MWSSAICARAPITNVHQIRKACEARMLSHTELSDINYIITYYWERRWDDDKADVCVCVSNESNFTGCRLAMNRNQQQSILLSGIYRDMRYCGVIARMSAPSRTNCATTGARNFITPTFFRHLNSNEFDSYILLLCWLCAMMGWVGDETKWWLNYTKEYHNVVLELTVTTGRMFHI